MESKWTPRTMYLAVAVFIGLGISMILDDICDGLAVNFVVMATITLLVFPIIHNMDWVWKQYCQYRDTVGPFTLKDDLIVTGVIEVALSFGLALVAFYMPIDGSRLVAVCGSLLGTGYCTVVNLVLVYLMWIGVINEND